MEELEGGKNSRTHIAVRSDLIPRGWLSLRERIIVDTYLKTFNLNECCRQVEVQTGRKVDVAMVHRWLWGKRHKDGSYQEPKHHILAYIGKRMKEDGWANMRKGEYLARLGEIADGDKEVRVTSLKAWELFGKVMGWLSPDVKVENRFNQAIQITQSDGSI